MVAEVIREGYKMTELGKIPVDWEIKKLKEIGTFSKGKGIAKKDLTESGHLCILYGELYTTYAETITDVVSRTMIDPQKSVIGTRNDVLIPSSGETAIDIATASSLCVDNVLIGGDINLFRPDKSILGSYISYSINSVMKVDLAKLAQGSSVYHLYASSLSEFNVILPSLPEQQKIVEILSTVDEQIENNNQLIAKTNELKKGLMWQLLTKGIGHIEFKQTEIGEIPVEWGVYHLSDVFSINSSSINPQTLKEELYHFSLPAYDESRIPIKENSQMIKSVKTLINQDSILVSKLNPRISRVWLIKAEDYQGLKVSSTEFINYTPSIDHVDLKYYYYLFSSQMFQEELFLRESGTTGSRKRVSPKETLEILVCSPPLKEQQKIANILSVVDEQIESYEQEKEKYTELKKGLMQQLLTGKIRVTV